MTYPKIYDDLIDAETWAFIRETERWFPPDTADKTVCEQRDIYNTMCRSFFAGYPDGVTSADSRIVTNNHAIPVRRYEMANASTVAEVIYFHGGGFVVGGLESHDDVCAEICAATGYPVTAVDYRLAPEHVFPADFEDAMAAFDHVGTSSNLPMILVGDSAGGNLAAAVAGTSRQLSGNPVGQVLIYPGLGADFTRGSFAEHAEAPMLTTQDMLYYNSQRTGGNARLLTHPACSPLLAADFSNVPPTVVFSAECDPLCDDGRDYCAAVNKSGGKALWIKEAGLVHGYLRARHSVGRARKSFANMTTAIAMLGRGEWPGRNGEIA